MSSFVGLMMMAETPIATAIFSYRTSARLSKKQVHEEIVRKARHLLKKAAAAT
jgi:hypothetical protein